MMKTFINNGDNEQALDLYFDTKYESLNKDNICHLLAIKACINAKDYETAIKIYNGISIDDKNIEIKTVLIEMYGNLNNVSAALDIFNSIKTYDRDALVVEFMMKVLMNHHKYEQLFEIYDEYVYKNIECYLMGIKACICNKDLIKGKRIHFEIMEQNNKGSKNVPNIINNALINMYAEFNDINSAINVFESINDEHRDIITISNMMKAYIYSDLNENALRLYDDVDIKQEYAHIIKDNVSHLLGIKACINTLNLNKGKEIDIQTRSVQDMYLKNALIDLYGSCFDITNAINVFNGIKDENKNIYTINSIMNAYCKNDMN
eukprot:433723_1